MDVFQYHEQLTEHIVSGGPKGTSEATYSPTLTQKFAQQMESLIRQYDIQIVYDLGSGDLTLPIYLAENTSVNVIAYELNESLVQDAVTFWKHTGLWDSDQITVREKNYSQDVSMIDETSDCLIANCGRTNHIDAKHFSSPLVSSYYGSEISVYNLPEEK